MSEPVKDARCPSPYHRPMSIYCLDCLPKDAPLGALLLSNREPTEDDLKRGRQVAKDYGLDSPTIGKDARCPTCGKYPNETYTFPCPTCHPTGSAPAQPRTDKCVGDCKDGMHGYGCPNDGDPIADLGSAPAQSNKKYLAAYCFECDDREGCASAETCYALHKGYPRWNAMTKPDPGSTQTAREFGEKWLISPEKNGSLTAVELACEFAEAYAQPFRERAEKAEALAAVPKWECHAAKFKCGYPGGGDPPDCDFPFCGCCPDAQKVINSLVEIDWGPASDELRKWRTLAGEMAEALREIEKIALTGALGKMYQIVQAARAVLKKFEDYTK